MISKPQAHPDGARFFDSENRDRGWAGKVTCRPQGLGGLTRLDVSGLEPGLAGYLSTLDRAPLTVQTTGDGAEAYTFQWASGYQNGADIRIQGMINPAIAARDD